MFKHIGRIAMAVLVTLALALGMTAFAGSANAASSTTSCSSQQAQVVKAKKQVAKDKKKIKKAKEHHHKKAVKKAKKKLRHDRKRLARAQAAYNACRNSSQTPAPAPADPGTPINPVTEQCTTVAGQLVALDPTGTLADGASAFCDLLGQLAGSTGGDPVELCTQLASQDPTGQLVQICDALGGASLPGGTGGVIGGTLEDVCDQLAAQDPTGQLSQLCRGLGSLPI